MSANFSLSLSNPAVTGNVRNIAYTGLPDGNTLDLVISSNFGYDMTIGGSSTGKYLELQVSGNIIDNGGVSKIGISAPWKIDSVVPPVGAGGNFTLNILPPQGGVVIPKGGTILLELTDFLPSAKGNGQVNAQYQFDNSGDVLAVSATLVVLAPPNPALPKLIGDEEALRFMFVVNSGSESTPLVVSASPATPDNAVQNTIQMVFDFQQISRLTEAQTNWLVDHWDPANPPEFRFFFPYFSPADPSPASIDLTDSFKSGDAPYNELTSAWNIKESLDSANPNIQSNGFWQISFDPGSPFPVWRVMPAAGNKHLFNTSGSDPNGPGPLLNLYWSHIISCLPIDQDNPETMLFVQWINFPGFNEGIQVFPLLKQYQKPIIKPVINSFSGQIVRDASGPKVLLSWDVDPNTAKLVQISGDSSLQVFSTGSTPYVRLVTLQQPLNTWFTLTAIGPEGPSNSTSQTIQVKWKLHAAILPTNWPNAIQLKVFEDNSAVVVLQCDYSGYGTSKLSFLNPIDLTPNRPAFSFPDRNQVFDMVLNPVDANLLYGVGENNHGGGMYIYAYNKSNNTVTQSSEHFYVDGTGDGLVICITADGTMVASTYISNGNESGRVVVFNTANLKQLASSPVVWDSPTYITDLALAPQSGRCLVNTYMLMYVLDPNALQNKDNFTGSIGTMHAFSSDEKQLYTTSALSKTLSLVDPNSFKIIKLIPSNLTNGDFRFKHLMTPDNSMLFILGTTKNSNVQTVNAYDLVNFRQLNWSPWDGMQENLIDLTLAPDGARMFALTDKGNVYALDPYF